MVINFSVLVGGAYGTGFLEALLFILAGRDVVYERTEKKNRLKRQNLMIMNEKYNENVLYTKQTKNDWPWKEDGQPLNLR